MDTDNSPNKSAPVAATQATPRKLSDLMTAFAASPSSTSKSNLRRQMQYRIDLTTMAISEAEASNVNHSPSPTPVQTASLANREEHSTTGDEIDDDDVIHGTYSIVIHTRDLTTDHHD
jgi:prophage DNA circulation protein